MPVYNLPVLIGEFHDQPRSGKEGGSETEDIGQDSRGRSVIVGSTLIKAIPLPPSADLPDCPASLAQKEIVDRSSYIRAQIENFNQFSNAEEMQQILKLLKELPDGVLKVNFFTKYFSYLLGNPSEKPKNILNQIATDHSASAKKGFAQAFFNLKKLDINSLLAKEAVPPDLSNNIAWILFRTPELISIFSLFIPPADLAKFCAQEDVWRTILNFREFGFDNKDPEDKKAIIGILKLCSQLLPMKTAECIHCFGLDWKDPETKKVLIEIAKFIAQQNGAFSRYIRSFWLDPKDPEDKKALIEIAKLCAQSSGGETAEYIRNFGLDPKDPEDKKGLIEILKLCVRYNADAVEYVHYFGLDPKDPEDKKVLIEIAMVCARQNGSKTAEYIRNFGLDPKDDREALIEIAKLCAQQSTEATAKRLHNFGLDKAANEELILMMGERSMDVLALLDGEANNTIAPLIEILKKGQFGCTYVMAQEAAEKELMHWLAENPLFKDMGLMLEGIKNPHVRDQLIRQLAATAILLSKHFNQKELELVIEEGLIQKVFHLRAPHLRMSIIGSLSHIFENPPRDSLSLDRLTLTSKYPEAASIEILAAGLKKQGYDVSGLIHGLNKQLFRTFKNEANLKAMIHFLLLLEKAPCDAKSKQSCLDKLTKSHPSEFVSNMQILIMILELEETDEFESPKTIKEMGDETLFKRLPQMDVDDISSKWLDTFGASRQPLAIVTYLAKVLQLGDEKATRCLASYIGSVLNGTFQKERYTLENPHLKMVGEKYIALWKEGSSKEVSSASVVAEIFNPKQWLEQKLLIDGHIANLSTTYPILYAALQGKPIVEREGISPFEELVLNLLDANEKNEQLQILGKLLNEAPGEFRNDVQGAIDLLSPPRRAPSQLTVIDTDDPYHLLLCGTEVQGSCQRIDGAPMLNRGLLGYLMNGQTRLIAVTDKSGRIVSRALLRLLYDSENERPVLFLERIYGSETHRQTLIDLATEKAKKMGLSLTILEDARYYDRAYKGSLESLGGVAPYEYCDGDSGVKTDGKYTIKKASIVYQAPNIDAEIAG